MKKLWIITWHAGVIAVTYIWWSCVTEENARGKRCDQIFSDGTGLVGDVKGILSCQVRLVMMTFVWRKRLINIREKNTEIRFKSISCDRACGHTYVIRAEFMPVIVLIIDGSDTADHIHRKYKKVIASRLGLDGWFCNPIILADSSSAVLLLILMCWYYQRFSEMLSMTDVLLKKRAGERMDIAAHMIPVRLMHSCLLILNQV